MHLAGISSANEIVLGLCMVDLISGRPAVM